VGKSSLVERWALGWRFRKVSFEELGFLLLLYFVG